MLVNRKSRLIGKKVNPRTVKVGESYYFPLPKNKAVRVVVSSITHEPILKQTNVIYKDDNGEPYIHIIPDSRAYPHPKMDLFEDRTNLLLLGNVGALRNKNVVKNFTRRRGKTARKLLTDAFAKTSPNPTATFTRRKHVVHHFDYIPGSNSHSKSGSKSKSKSKEHN